MGVQHRVIQHGAAAHVEGTEILTVLLVLGATTMMLLHMWASSSGASQHTEQLGNHLGALYFPGEE